MWPRNLLQSACEATIIFLMLKKLLSQITTLLVVSTLNGFAFVSFGSTFIIGFLAGTVVQFGIYYGFMNLIELYAALQNKKLENERLREFSLQSLEVTCPCHRQIKEIIPVRLNTDNRYKCTECSKTVSILITPETAIATEPIINTDISLLNKNIAERLSNANT